MKIGASERFLYFIPHNFFNSKDRVTHMYMVTCLLFRPGNRKISVFYYSLIDAFHIDRFHARICMHRN